MMTPNDLAKTVQQMIDEAERKGVEKAADLLVALAKVSWKEPIDKAAMDVVETIAKSIRGMPPRQIDAALKESAYRQKPKEQ